MKYPFVPDDAIRRHQAKWLGPDGHTLPVFARYTAYSVFAVLITLFVFLGSLTPYPIEWLFTLELCAALGITRVLMEMVSHNKPVMAVLENLWLHVTTPRFKTPTPVTIRPVLRRNIKRHAPKKVTT